MIVLQQRIGRLPAAAASRHRSFGLLAAFSIVASILMGFNFIFSVFPIHPGLDSSFIYAFNYAAAKHLSWGRDFISTYGPYGYVIQTMDVGDLVKSKVAFNLLLAVASGIVAAAYLQSVPGLRPTARLGLAAALLYALSLQYQEYQWLVLFLLVFLMGLHARERSGLTAYALASLLAGFFLLIKFSLGFGALMTLAFGCLLVRRPLMGAYRLAVAISAATVSFLIGWIAQGRTLTGIGAYVATGWELSSGYSSAMSSAPHGWRIGVTSFLIYFVLVALWVVKQPTTRTLLTLAGLAVPLFLAWKHSIVRQDNHVFYLMNFGLFVIVLLLVEAGPVWRWRSTLPIAGILLVPLAIPWFNAGTGGPNAARSLKEHLSGPLELHGLRDLAKLGHLVAYREGLARVSESALRKSVLPQSVRDIIGRSSVDVYPWEISYVPANGLSWVNRPLPASFSTYTPALDGLNAAFFESHGRPEYLIWHTDGGVNSIDGRYLFWDEPRTLRAIGNYYDIVKADASVILLRARAHPRFALPQRLGTMQVAWNTWIPVPQAAGVLLAEASIERSLLLRLIRIGFREDPVRLSVRFSSGEEAKYRLVPDNMGGGLWISPFAVTVNELHSLFQGGPARRVVAIRFSGRMVSRLSSSIVVSWSELRPLSVPGPAVQPPRIPTRGAINGPCAGFIDGLYRGHDWYGRSAVIAVGWARDGDLPVTPESLRLVDGDGRFLATEVQTGLPRSDVAQALGVPSLGGSGWAASARTDREATDVGFIVRTRSGKLVGSCNKRGETYKAPQVETFHGVATPMQAVQK